MVERYGRGLALPDQVPNFINGEDVFSEGIFEKFSPVNGKLLAIISSSVKSEVDFAVSVAQGGFSLWAATPAVNRGMALYRVVQEMERRKVDIASLVAVETGKTFKDALAETEGAIQLGLFFSSEGQRFFGRSAPSGIKDRFAVVTREPVGIAALIVPANTPIANIAWKVFPALVCGNSVILKSSEDAPLTAALFADITQSAGLPRGVFNVIHGTGAEAGESLVSNPAVGVISFTGSTEVGRRIQMQASSRFARVSLELGGKNPMVVCDDADLAGAVGWAVLSAFSNAGQRCASASRIIVMQSLFNDFVDAMAEATKKLRIGCQDTDDLGPLIRESHLYHVLGVLRAAEQNGAKIISGGRRCTVSPLHLGFFLEPTIVVNAKMDDPISRNELFAPVTCVYSAKTFCDAVEMANDSIYGLTAAIHTKDLNRAMEFSRRMISGVVSVNGGTHGSEPHMPFGGRKASGNGTREPGPEAIEVYSTTKNIVINYSGGQV